MTAWTELTSDEMKEVWEIFYHKFRFRPWINSSRWPGIREPEPSVTYSIGSFYGRSPDQFLALENDLCLKTIGAFRKCIPQESMIFALDWHHSCYWLDYEADFDWARSDEWKIPVFPNGDYYIFLSQRLEWGIFGHPWEQTMCVFGDTLLEAFESDMPSMFSDVVRRDGKTLWKRWLRGLVSQRAG